MYCNKIYMLPLKKCFKACKLIILTHGIKHITLFSSQTWPYTYAFIKHHNTNNSHCPFSALHQYRTIKQKAMVSKWLCRCTDVQFICNQSQKRSIVQRHCFPQSFISTTPFLHRNNTLSMRFSVCGTFRNLYLLKCCIDFSQRLCGSFLNCKAVFWILKL